MLIAFRNRTQAGNNTHCYLFFNGLRVGEIHCTPKEFSEFVGMLHAGNQALGNTSEDIVVD